MSYVFNEKNVKRETTKQQNFDIMKASEVYEKKKDSNSREY